MYLESGYSVKLEIKNSEEVKHCREIEDFCDLNWLNQAWSVVEVMEEVELIEKIGENGKKNQISRKAAVK